MLAPLLLLTCASYAAELLSGTQAGKTGKNTGGGTPDSFRAAVTGTPGPGRYVFFESKASDFLPGLDNNQMADVYMADAATGKVIAMSSVGTDGKSSLSGGSHTPVAPEFSWANGKNQFVAFESDAHNLIASYTKATVNSQTQIFARDWALTSTRLVTKSKDGDTKGATGDASLLSVSADGKVLAFSFAGQVPNLKGLTGITDGNSAGSDIVFWRFPTDKLEAASVRKLAPTVTGNGDSTNAVVSEDGNCIVFESTANNLDGIVTGSLTNIYVRYLDVPVDTVLVSRSPTGVGGDGNSTSARPNADCSFIAFASTATNLVPPGVSDSNGAASDVFLWSRSAPTTLVPLSLAKGGTSTGNSGSSKPSIGGPITDGIQWHLRVVFESGATNLLANGIDDNGSIDVYFDTPSVVEIQADKAQWTEGDGTIALTVSRSGNVAQAITVEFVGVGVPGHGFPGADAATLAQRDVAEGVCNNAIDDDNDGKLDCDDADCMSDLSCGKKQEEDEESDGIANINDNCVKIANADQLDTDADGIGNACDTSEDSCGNFLDDDTDGLVDCLDSDCAKDIVCVAPAGDDDQDGVPNGTDNCPNAANTLQEDSDSDSVGDACDTAEGLCNDGLDNDADAKSDCADEDCVKDVVCQKPDEDTDGDLVVNALDDCPFVANPEQDDTDGDG
ncbi:MAG: hypothetical protein EXR75_12340, partial [Myxococcales bacterium]|nr:hypothetical protein [Myxococcales bacterium]